MLFFASKYMFKISSGDPVSSSFKATSKTQNNKKNIFFSYFFREQSQNGILTYYNYVADRNSLRVWVAECGLVCAIPVLTHHASCSTAQYKKSLHSSEARHNKLQVYLVQALRYLTKVSRMRGSLILSPRNRRVSCQFLGFRRENQAPRNMTTRFATTVALIYAGTSPWPKLRLEQYKIKPILVFM